MVVLHAYVAVCYTLSLCGSEGFLLNLAGLNQKFTVGGDRYVVVALLGKVQGESDAWAPLATMRPYYLFRNQHDNFSAEIDQIQTHMRLCRWSCYLRFGRDPFLPSPCLERFIAGGPRRIV
jgi:hypothetical protein